MINLLLQLMKIPLLKRIISDILDLFLSVSLQEMGDNSSEGLKLESFNLNIVNTHTNNNYLIRIFEYRRNSYKSWII